MANLSLGGCFARTPLPPAADDQMQLTLFFAGRGAMVIKGHIARVEPGVGFGFQFDELMPEARHRLRDEVAQIRRRLRGPIVTPVLRKQPADVHAFPNNLHRGESPQRVWPSRTAFGCCDVFDSS
jgi:hypothetical protein